MLTLHDRPDAPDRSVAWTRTLVAEPAPRDATLAVLASAALCALCALALAGSVILGPPMAARGGDSAPAVRGAL